MDRARRAELYEQYCKRPEIEEKVVFEKATKDDPKITIPGQQALF